MYTSFPIPQKDYYKVYVRSSTYNQSQYIVDCLNGVAMQKTDFPFIHHVVDDCSADGEQDVIKAWIESECDLETAQYYDNDICSITIAKNKTNPNCTLAVYFLKKNMYGNPEKRKLFKAWQDVCHYEALCEGDDYWIDSNKLQKQIDFLDHNQNYTLCFHQAMEHFEYSNIDDRIFKEIKDGDYDSSSIFGDWIIATASAVFRTSIMQSSLYKQYTTNKKIIFGDTPLFLTCAHYGKVRGMSQTMSVYRRQEDGETQAYMERNPRKEIKLCVHNYEIYRIFGDNEKQFRSFVIKYYIHPLLRVFIGSVIHRRKIQYGALFQLIKTEPCSTIIELSKIKKWK